MQMENSPIAGDYVKYYNEVENMMGTFHSLVDYPKDMRTYYVHKEGCDEKWQSVIRKQMLSI